MYVFRIPSVLILALITLVVDIDMVDAYWLFRAGPPVALPLFVMGCCAALTAMYNSAKATLDAEQKETEESSLDRRPFHLADLVGCGLLLVQLLMMLGRRFIGNANLTILLRPMGELLSPWLQYELMSALTSI